MPSLPFFADGRDATALVDWLNRDPEIAFIVPDDPSDPQAAYVKRVRVLLGPTTDAANLYPCFALADASDRQSWRAVRTIERLPDGKHSLWHISSGRLPLAPANCSNGTPLDPWVGWTQHRCASDPTLPEFGPGHHAEIYLELWTRHRPYSRSERTSLPALLYYWTGEEEVLVVSSFGWIGDHFAPAPRSAWKWWQRLEAWVASRAVPISECRPAGPNVGTCGHFWAFPSALEKLKRGMAIETRGWDLDLRITA
jgi:hypothetical protein